MGLPRIYHGPPGPIPLKHVYSATLERELAARGQEGGREMAVAIRYKCDVATARRVDKFVDGRVVVDIKSRP